MIVADALYLNAPFINMVLELGMDAVIRLKDEKRFVFQNAERLFRQGKGRKADYQILWSMMHKRWDIEENDRRCKRNAVSRERIKIRTKE